MKRLLVIALILCVCVPAFALSDPEYRRLKKDPDFARADRDLTRAYNEAKEALSPEEFSEFRKDQRQWIAKDRDVRARTFMNKGCSKAEAYTMATIERTKGIRARLEVVEKGLFDVRDIDDAYYDNGKGSYLHLSLYNYSDMIFEVSFSGQGDKVTLEGRYDYDNKSMSASDGDLNAELLFDDPDTVNIRVNGAFRRAFSVNADGKYKRHY